jgi:hypothetical protein
MTFRHTFARPTSDIPYFLASVLTGIDHTSRHLTPARRLAAEHLPAFERKKVTCAVARRRNRHVLPDRTDTPPRGRYTS